MVDRLELEARFNDRASVGVKRLGKTLDSVRPSNGMAAAQKWMGDFRMAADKANVAVRPLATGLSAVGIGGLAASLSMGELVKQFKDLADSTLSMRELGRQTGMSATAIAQLQYAAGKLHVDPAAVGGAISSWSGQMLDFRRHTSDFYRYLLRQNSGVAQKIAADSPVQGLKDTLDYISRIRDPQVQKRVADMAGVGDLVPMLGKGPQGLVEAFADAAREVKPISAELQAAADRFNDATNHLNQVWTDLKNDIGPAVLDPLSGSIGKLGEALKLVAASPGDAATGAAVIAGSFAAFWVRARVMRAVSGGAAGRATAELQSAATKQIGAGASLLEAAAELKAAARALGLRGAPPGAPPGSGPSGPSPEEDPKKPGSPNSFSGARALAFTFGWAGLVANAPGIDEEGGREREGNASALNGFGNAIGFGALVRAREAMFGKGRTGTDVIADWWKVHQATGAGPYRTPFGYERETRARARALPPNETPPDLSRPYWERKERWLHSREQPAPTNTDGNALHRHDDELSAVTAQDLFATVKQGSKEGIVAGLREMAQQQELAGGGGGSGVGETDGGAPNMRYGRPRASSGWRTTPGRHSAGAAGGDHGSSGPPGIDYNAKSATEQMGVSQKEWDAFREGVTDIEGKKYNHMGGAGGRYAGRYQMGPAEIDATARRLGVARPSNAQFMADPAMQERFFENYTMDHYRTLMRNKSFAAMSHREQLKILGYAHNQGTGGPTRENGAWGYLDRGAVGHDAFGTSGTAYFKTIQRRLDQSDSGAAADAFKERERALRGTPPITVMPAKPKPQASLDDLDFRRSLPNIIKLARAESGDGGASRVDHEFGPVQIDIRHHQNGRATVAARGGQGTKLAIKSGPTMQMA